MVIVSAALVGCVWHGAERSAHTEDVPFTFADNDRVLAACVDPNVVHQPNITFDKFTTMKNEIIKDHGDMYVNFKKSGHHEEMYSFCKVKDSNLMMKVDPSLTSSAKPNQRAATFCASPLSENTVMSLGVCLFRALFGVLPCPPGSEFAGTGKGLPTQESPESKTSMSLLLSFVLTQLKLEKHLRLQARTSSPRPPSPHDYPALTALRNTPGSLDTYYYGLMCEKYPGIEQASCQMLPEGTESENTGVGGGGGRTERRRRSRGRRQQEGGGKEGLELIGLRSWRI
ncbi:unnamed protein product [Ectocarpus sp. CCAP 1310/34]|nr:unnamed protein product [Ectocarpus sp. CCAP 1310/34]